MNEEHAKKVIVRQSPEGRALMLNAIRVDNDTVDVWCKRDKVLPTEIVEQLIAYAEGNYGYTSVKDGIQRLVSMPAQVVPAAVPTPPYNGGRTSYAMGQPAQGCTPYLMTKPGGPVMGGKTGTKPLTLSLPTFGRG